MDKMSTLVPAFRQRVADWFKECWDHQLYVYIYEGFRSNERQDELYAQGRTTEGRIVTNALPGQSFHNYGRAIDWVPLVAHPKALGLYEPPQTYKPSETLYEAEWNLDDLYNVGIAKAHRYRLRALSWENPHLEDTDFASWRDLI